jgi:hypothetical protein
MDLDAGKAWRDGRLFCSQMDYDHWFLDVKEKEK